jgi:hypothetical protein
MVYTIYLSITYIFNIKYKYELLKFREKKRKEKSCSKSNHLYKIKQYKLTLLNNSSR